MEFVWFIYCFNWKLRFSLSRVKPVEGIDLVSELIWFLFLFQRDALSLEPSNVANCVSKGKSEVSSVSMHLVWLKNILKFLREF